MLRSKFFLPTLKKSSEKDKDTVYNYMIRAGMIRQNSSGIYTFLPLAVKVATKISNIIRDELTQIDASEILFPILVPKLFLDKTERWDLFGTNLMSLKDRTGKEFALGPTHEENATFLGLLDIHSYKDLPFCVYQIAPKFRDELRPRFGVIRTKEFYMKDAYSYHADNDSLIEYYNKMKKAYFNIFKRVGINVLCMVADSGDMGGLSEEFLIESTMGESYIVKCEQCDYLNDLEIAECSRDNLTEEQNIISKKLEKILTPHMRTIKELSSFLKKSQKEMIKTLVYLIKGSPVLILLRSDLKLSEKKLLKRLNISSEDIKIASEIDLKNNNIEKGFVGPLNCKLQIIADNSIKSLRDAVVGANEKNYHYLHFDWKVASPELNFYDVSYVQENDRCQCQNGDLKIVQAMEIGHIFRLGANYATKMEVNFLDKNGKKQTPLMGCYGIGIHRIMGVILEKYHDEGGLVFPTSITPFHITLLPLNMKDERQEGMAQSLYEKYKNKWEILFDDRKDVRPGVKFADADLIGIPIQIIIGNRFIKEEKVEIKVRKNKKSFYVKEEEITNFLEDFFLKEN